MTIQSFPHSGEGPLIRLYQMPPEDIGFLTSLVEAYEGIGLVRTLDRTRGIIECWVMRDGMDSWDAILASIRRRVPVQSIQPGEMD